MKLKDYLFIDNGTGEQFFVEHTCLEFAWEVALDNFNTEDLEYLGEYTVEEAEILGFDTF